ncbi:MAG: hypothetical protein ACD_75C01121G0003, partial [uncultured bacterium]
RGPRKISNACFRDMIFKLRKGFLILALVLQRDDGDIV